MIMILFKHKLNLLWILIILLFSNCATELPLLDAKINSEGSTYKLSCAYQATIIKDVFPNDNQFVSYHDNSNFITGIYGSPFLLNIGRVFKDRLELGCGLLGIYNKFGIILPKDYSYFSLKNIAVTQIATAGMSWVWEISIETTLTGGLLIGLPFSQHFSISSGFLYQHQRAGSASETDPNLLLIRNRYIVPVSFIFKFNRALPFLRNLDLDTLHLLSFSIELPRDMSECYKYDSYETPRDLIFSKRTNIKLKIALMMGIHQFHR